MTKMALLWLCFQNKLIWSRKYGITLSYFQDTLSLLKLSIIGSLLNLLNYWTWQLKKIVYFTVDFKNFKKVVKKHIPLLMRAYVNISTKWINTLNNGCRKMCKEIISKITDEIQRSRNKSTNAKMIPLRFL